MLLGIVTTDASDKNCRSRNADLATLLAVLALAVSFKLELDCVCSLLRGHSALRACPARSAGCTPLDAQFRRGCRSPLPASWLVARARRALEWLPRICPGPAFSPGLEWRVPVEQAEAENAWIRHFARTYYSAAAYNDKPYVYTASVAGGWLRPWLRSLLTTASARWQVSDYPGGGRGNRGGGCVGPAPASTSVTFCARVAALDPTWAAAPRIAAWFVIAPRPVFGFALFWILAALVVALLLEPRLEAGDRGRGFVAIATLIAILPVLLQAADAAIRRGGIPSRCSNAPCSSGRRRMHGRIRPLLLTSRYS